MLQSKLCNKKPFNIFENLTMGPWVLKGGGKVALTFGRTSMALFCDLEKLLRLRKTLYCFNFAVCLISYLYQIVRLWLHWLLSECAWGERKGLIAGRNSIEGDLKYSEFYSYVFKLNYGLASKLLGTLRYTTVGCSVSSANLKQIKISLYSYGVFSIYVTLQKWIPSYVRLCSTFIQQRLNQ